MAVNKDSQKIMKLLAEVKTQYSTLSGLIKTADDRLEKAREATEALRKRTDIINRKLASVEEADISEADNIFR